MASMRMAGGGWVFPPLQFLDEDSAGSSATVADTGKAIFAGLEIHGHVADDTSPRHADGMTKGDRSSINVNLQGHDGFQ